MTNVQDIAIVGAGPGGYVAALYAAQKGARVLLIEKEKLGGTCLHRGCIPTKSLLKSIKVLKSINQAPDFGITVENIKVDFSAIMDRKKKVVEDLYDGLKYLIDKHQITVLQGKASFKNNHEILVETGNDKQILAASNVIISAGSKPFIPSFIEVDGEKILTSDHILNMETVPKSLLIIGGGVIGVEFATIFSNLGTKVILFETLPALLANFDQEIAARITQKLGDSGIDIRTMVKVTGIEANQSSKVKVYYEVSGAESAVIEVDKVLLAAGRIPNIDELNLNLTDVKLENSKIAVDKHMKTSVDHIYAVGDVLGRIQLANVASREGLVAVDNILGQPTEMNHHTIPYCIYTEPEVAVIGMTEEQAKEQNISITVGQFSLTNSGKANIEGEIDGLIKIVADQKYGQVLGVHIYSIGATELISGIGLGMNLEITIDEILKTSYAHPTFSEIIIEAAYDWLGTPLHQP